MESSPPSQSARSMADQPADGLQHVLYLPTYQVLVCRSCKYAVIGVKRHLKDKHQKWPLAQRKAIETYASTLRLALPRDVADPSPPAIPLPSLALYKGWGCTSCAHQSPSDETMRKHAQEQHGWVQAKGLGWRPAYVQTLFGGSNRRYFEVTAPTAQQRPTGQGLLDAVVRKGEEEDRKEAMQETVRAIQDQLDVDTTSWMRKTRWPRKFAGKNLRAVAELGVKPAPSEPLLKLVWDAAGRVLDQCMKSITRWHDEEEDADFVLRWLASSQKATRALRPFRVQYQAPTLARYASYWKRLLCYILRLVHHDDRHGHVLPESEEGHFNRLWEVLQLGDAEADSATLDEIVFRLSVRLWTHTNVAGSRSSIVHFAAVLGIDERRGCYREPADYSQILVGLLHCGRLLLFEHALPQRTRGTLANPLAALLATHNAWLIDDEPTPFAHLNDLRAFARAVAQDGGGKSRVYWSADRQTLIYQGQQIPLHTLRQFVQELRGKADRLLADLAFLDGPSKAREVCLSKVTDDMSNSTVGYSFVSDPANDLGKGRREMLDRIGTSPAWADMICPDGAGGLVAHDKRWAAYERRLDELRDLLLLLMHITGGGPARGTEMCTIRFENAAENMRNLFVLDGQVLFVTLYHKSEAITNQNKVIPRFLPGWLGQMVVVLVSQVLPFARLVDRTSVPAGYRTFLWAGRKGLRETNKISEVLAQETSMALGVRITFQDYRHVAIAIDREHVRGLTGDMSESDDAHDLGAAHTSRTADSVYALDATMLKNMGSRVVNVFREVTGRWHRFLCVDGGMVKRKAGDALQPIPLPVSKQLRRLDREQARPLVKAALVRLFGPTATFRCQEQEDALLAVVSRESVVVVVLPTGGGKSLVFQLPASFPDAGVTVVVVPLKAICKDLIRRCRDLGIQCEQWMAEQPRWARVTIVVAETAAGNSAFHIVLSALQAKGQLDRIVIDECHAILTSTRYRKRIADLEKLRMIPCQFVLLTGTLPLCLEPILASRMLLGEGTCYIRGPTDRVNAAYSAKTCKVGRLVKMVGQVVRARLSGLAPGERILVFSQTVLACKELAESLRCQTYYGGYEGNEESLQLWAGGSAQVLVATPALAEGVDVPGVVLVVHASIPYGLIDFAQGVGRGGRGGERFESVVVLDERELQHLRAEQASPRDKPDEAMRQFLLTDACRRVPLRSFLDGKDWPCEEGHSEACDNCVRARREVGETLEQGPQLLREAVRGRAYKKQALEEAIHSIGSGCAICWVYQEVDYETHQPKHCHRLAEGLDLAYGEARRMIKYAAHSCCYTCSLPADWCHWYQTKQRCASQDCVVPIALAGWIIPHVRERLEQESGVYTTVQLVDWMAKPTRQGEVNMTNAVYAAGLVLQLLNINSTTVKYS